MKQDFPTRWAESPATQRREPTNAELASGFPCGPWDMGLFNELMYRLTQVYGENANAIASTGQSPSALNLTQLASTIRRPLYAADTGTANHVILPAASILNWDQREGCLISFRATATNTGATDIAIGGAAAAALTYGDGSALQGGAIVGGRRYLALTNASGGATLYGIASPSDVSAAVLSPSVFSSIYNQFFATPLTYWRFDTPNVTIPAMTQTGITNWGNLYQTVNSGTTLSQANGTVTIGSSDAGTYVLTASAAITNPTIEESLFIVVDRIGTVGLNRGVTPSPGTDANDRAACAVVRLQAGDVVRVNYSQTNAQNEARTVLQQPFVHFGGARVGG